MSQMHTSSGAMALDHSTSQPASKALARAHRQWHTWGKKDPLWAILSEPDKKDGRWNPDEFFETGRIEVADVLKRAMQLAPVEYNSAMDFGCGIGRLSLALAEHFESVVGIDVAESMISQANEVNRSPERCRYIHNLSENIAVLADRSVDFIYSSITLQHVETPLACGYLREFFRIATPGGHVIFQLPSRPRSPLWHRIKSMAPKEFGNFVWRMRTASPEAMETYFMSEDQVRSVVEAAGGEVLAADPNRHGPPGWDSRRYFCIRKAD